MSRHEVQQALRDIFSQWGLPERTRVDNGYPWGSWSDLPCDLALWLIGLGVEMIWNRPRSPQQNGVVERAQGTTARWSEPNGCVHVQLLEKRLEEALQIQREHYPALRDGRTRREAYPELECNPRGYERGLEAEMWELSRVGEFLATRMWTRRVDKGGSVSLYNRNLYASTSLSGQEVSVRFDPDQWQWVFLAENGEELRRHAAEEISTERICRLQVSHRRKLETETGGKT